MTYLSIFSIVILFDLLCFLLFLKHSFDGGFVRCSAWCLLLLGTVEALLLTKKYY